MNGVKIREARRAMDKVPVKSFLSTEDGSRKGRSFGGDGISR